MRIPYGSAALPFVAVLASVLILALPVHDAGAQAQGSSFTLSPGASALGESGSQCAALGGSWSNETFVCTISTSGALGSGGSLEVESGAGLTISTGATFANSGTIQNNGTVTNSGTIQNNGTLTNSGTVSSTGDIINVGTIANDPSGVIINEGAINNEVGGSITNARDFYNDGDITSSGSFTNSCAGELIETGTFSGNPVVSCGTTSTFSQSTSATAPTGSSARSVVLDGSLAFAVVGIIVLFIWRGGIRKASSKNPKK